MANLFNHLFSYVRWRYDRYAMYRLGQCRKIWKDFLVFNHISCWVDRVGIALILEIRSQYFVAILGSVWGGTHNCKWIGGEKSFNLLVE